LNRKLEKTLIAEKHKVLNSTQENDHLKLTTELRTAHERINELYEKSKTSSTIQNELQQVTQERDYLHSMLQDNAEIERFSSETNSYTLNTRQCIIKLTSYNVPSSNVGPVIKEVLKLSNRIPNATPTRTTVTLI